MKAEGKRRKGMKVVVAIDSFKGSLSSMEAGMAMKEGILKADPQADVVVKPLADGGEGTTEAFVEGMNGTWIETEVTGPMGEKVTAAYGYLEESQTAVMEMAQAAGITMVTEETRDVKKATTYGVGEMIKDAIQRGCRKFLIGIGGSATNDCGIGMLAALGAKFYDKDGNPAGIDCEAAGKIVRIETQEMLPQLKECEFQVACDVTNPLCGTNGATYIYGPQKGVKPEMLEELDGWHRNFALKTKEALGCDYAETPGAGAAGGLGFALLSYLNANLESGISLVIDAVGLKEAVKDADFVVTGEGRLDHQTAMGKVPVGVAKMAKTYGAKVVAVAGSVTKDAKACNQEGIDAYFPILPGILTLQESMEKDNAKQNMQNTGEQIFRLICACRGKEA